MIDHLELLKNVYFLQKSFRGVFEKNSLSSFLSRMVELFYFIFKEYKPKFLNVLKSNHTIILKRGKINLNFVP